MRETGLGRIIGHIQLRKITMKTVSQEAGFDLHFDRSDSEWGAEMNCEGRRLRHQKLRS